MKREFVTNSEQAYLTAESLLLAQCPITSSQVHRYEPVTNWIPSPDAVDQSELIILDRPPCSDSVTEIPIISDTYKSTVSRRMVYLRPHRTLKLVVLRAKQTVSHRNEPSYKLTTYVETLECGHKVWTMERLDVAKRRHCEECAKKVSR